MSNLIKKSWMVSTLQGPAEKHTEGNRHIISQKKVFSVFSDFPLIILKAFIAYLETILKALEAFNQLVATERWGATDIAFLPTNDDFDPKYVDCRYTYVDSNFQSCPPTYKRRSKSGWNSTELMSK